MWADNQSSCASSRARIAETQKNTQSIQTSFLQKIKNITYSLLASKFTAVLELWNMVIYFRAENLSF